MSFQGIRKIRQTRRQSPILFGSQEIQVANSTSRPLKLDFQFLLNQAQNLPTSKQFRKKAEKQELTRRQTRKSSYGKSQSKDEKRLTPRLGNFLHVNLEDINKFHNRKFSDVGQTSRAQTELKKEEDKKRMNWDKKMCLSDYSLEFVVGKGGFGKVWKGRLKKSSKIFAIKQMQKVKIIEKKSVNSVMNERSLLSKLRHPLLVNMHCSFQNKENLFLVMDYCNRGDLRYHIGRKQRFKQNQTKFFLACILHCLEYLHKKKIIHRDLKPQNLVLDHSGYVRVTDLGVSRELRSNNADDTSGTPGYMAPEVICRKNHSFCVDFFAVGVIGYEFMMGKRPYVGQNRKEIRQKILAKQVQLGQIPPFGWSRDSIDFINKLIQRSPQNRLGYKGIEEVKNHSWFRGFDWLRLEDKKLCSPFIPSSIEDDYTNYKECISEDTQIADHEEYKLILRHPDTQRAFCGYETVEKNNKDEKYLRRKNEKKEIQQYFHMQTVREKFFH